MAEVIDIDIHDVSRSDMFRLVPLGDIHIGAAACDEDLLAQVVKGIADDDNAYWVGLGDYCEFINMRDWRFNVDELADWIKREDLTDLAQVQRDRFLMHIEPIAHKCWGLASGNHEHEIHRHTERAIYDEIVAKVKKMGGMPESHKLGIGIYGWLRANFLRSKEDEDKHIRTALVVNIHHGFTGGRLKGAKALNMEKWLWNHECDVAIFGHSHNTDVLTVAVERINKAGQIESITRKGVYAGSFRRTVVEGHTTYSERMGFFPLPILGCELHLRPGAERRQDRVKVLI
jgi:hypothetical protein